MIVVSVRPSITASRRGAAHGSFAADLDAVHPAPDRESFEAAPDGLDLGEFGHGAGQLSAFSAATMAANAALAAACSAAFFERPSPFAEQLLGDEHPGVEPLVVIRAGRPDLVIGRHPSVVGQSFLEGGLVVERVERVERGIEPWHEQPLDQVERHPESAVDVHRAEHRFHRVGQDRHLLPTTGRVFASAQQQMMTQVEFERDFGQRVAFTTLLRRSVSAPSARSAYSRKTRSAITQPRTASPRNSRRSLLCSSPDSATQERWHIARRSNSGSANW